MPLTQRLANPGAVPASDSSLMKFDEVKAALILIALDMKVGHSLDPIPQNDETRCCATRITIDGLPLIWVVYKDGDTKWYCNEQGLSPCSFK